MSVTIGGKSVHNLLFDIESSESLNQHTWDNQRFLTDYLDSTQDVLMINKAQHFSLSQQDDVGNFVNSVLLF